MFARLENIGKYALFIFDNTRQKRYSSSENRDILVKESTVNYLGRRSHPGIHLALGGYSEIFTLFGR